MKVIVQPVHVDGTPISKASRNLREIFPGELRMLEQRNEEFGRSLLVAEVLINTDGKNVPSIQLYDAKILYVLEKRMRISGVELRGSIKYGQTWDVELVV